LTAQRLYSKTLLNDWRTWKKTSEKFLVK
jgi:hypothetical protein